MLVYRRLPPSILSGCPNSSLVPICTSGWRGHCESNVSCPITQHNDPASAPTQNTRSGVQCANHQATASSTHCSNIGNTRSLVDFLPFHCSTLSPEGGSDSESSDSDEDLESPGRKAASVPFENDSSPQGSPVKQPPPATDNKMEVDPTDGM